MCPDHVTVELWIKYGSLKKKNLQCENEKQWRCECWYVGLVGGNSTTHESLL